MSTTGTGEANLLTWEKKVISMSLSTKRSRLEHDGENSTDQNAMADTQETIPSLPETIWAVAHSNGLSIVRAPIIELGRAEGTLWNTASKTPFLVPIKTKEKRKKASKKHPTGVNFHDAMLALLVLSSSHQDPRSDKLRLPTCHFAPLQKGGGNSFRS